MNARIRRAVIFILILSAAAMVSGQSQPVARISQPALMQHLEGQHDVLLIDVRTAEEFSMGHIPGAINIPYTELVERLGEVRPHHAKGVVLYCATGRRADIAERLLREAGLDNIQHLEGDMSAWRQSDLPIEKTKR